LALNDFWLFPEIKSALKGQRFWDIEDIQKNATTALKAIHNKSFKSVSNSGSIIQLTAKLPKGSTSKVTPFSYL
jgi:hypothetical protein